MRQARLAPYRGRVVSTATGRVLEVGIGSGLNVPFYGRTVNQVVGLEPSPKLLDMAHKAALRRAAAMPACNAILVKPNQVGTVSEAMAAVEAARAAHWGAIVSARSGETEDVTIVHLAVGWGVLQLKVGSFSRSERMAKWNEALRIEEALDGRARFAGAEPWRG
jgi:SAM-dependent methyltransferase